MKFQHIMSVSVIRIGHKHRPYISISVINIGIGHTHQWISVDISPTSVQEGDLWRHGGLPLHALDKLNRLPQSLL